MALFRLGVGLAGIAGVLLHITLFVHGEWDAQAPLLLCSLLSIYFVSTTASMILYEQTVQESCLDRSQELTIFFVAVWTSMIVYRFHFHRLRDFPGL